MAETIIALGKAFDMTTVAEGVETPEQFEMLAHLGCDQSQGYLHSRPMSVGRYRTPAADRQRRTFAGRCADPRGNVDRPSRLTTSDNI